MRARKNLRTSVERKEMVTLKVSKETEKRGVVGERVWEIKSRELAGNEKPYKEHMNKNLRKLEEEKQIMGQERLMGQQRECKVRLKKLVNFI